MDTQGYTTQFGTASGTASGRGQLALITFVVGGLLGAALGWTADRPATTLSAVGTADLAASAVVAPAVAAPSSSRARKTTPARRSIAVVIPGERDYITSATLAVAGTAYGRPHGPRVRSVQVELYVAGEMIDRAELDVFSSRFAGVLELPKLLGRVDAELRISNPTRPSGPTVVRHITIHAPASAEDASG